MGKAALLLPALLLFSSRLPASQSSLEQRSSYDSAGQFTEMILGTWGYDQRAFANGSVAFARSPAPVNFGYADTFYQISLGGGLSVENVAFDVGLNGSDSPLTKIVSIGGYGGLTYIHAPDGTDPGDQREHALGLLHSQIYPTNVVSPPQFWIRAAFLSATMASKLLADGATGRETAFLIDGYYPIDSRFLLSVGASFHSYDDARGFYAAALQNTSDMHLQLLGTTIQGLPQWTGATQLTWEIAPRDAMIPRYQATNIAFSGRWSHTMDLGWRHQFSSHWFLHPAYEATILQDQLTTGFLLALLYNF